MTKIAIIVGSTRPGRRAGLVASWVAQVAARHPAISAGEASVDVVDLAEYGLPLLDEPLPAAWGEYRNPHTDRWAATTGQYDGFVFVTPEYNHSVPAALKNAIDYLFAEWHDKAAGFVSYGAQSGGTRAVEHLRHIMAELKVATVRTQVALSLFADFEITHPTQPGVCAPQEYQESTLSEMIGEVVTWSTALRSLRTEPVPA